MIILFRLIPAYAMVIQPVSIASVRLRKFRPQSTREAWTFGIFATEKIPAGIFLYELMGLMAENPYQKHSDLSEVYPHPAQNKGQSPRVLFGPIRFVNHECQSNCEVRTLPDFHASSFNL